MKLAAVIIVSWFCLLVSLTPTQGAPKPTSEFELARLHMVEHEIAAAGVKNPRVLDSMRSTPRHEFMPIPERGNAYLDMALPIGEGQTISPPFIVAYMTEQLDPQATDKVLEIGTGSGYQAAILSPLVKDVYTIEIKDRLGEQAARTLKRLGYKNVHTRIGDGFQGWPDAAPFDKIIVTCSPEEVPQPLVDQLREGGRMIIPKGERYQQTLYLFEKKNGELKSVALLPTLFVPMTGKAEDNRLVKPDPANPELRNGGFELAADGKPTGWHYQRQLKLIKDAKAPEGEFYATFRNDEPGRGAQALQGLAIDGRKIHEIELSAWVRGVNVRAGPGMNEQPMVLILFYDSDRRQLAANFLGPWHGTFDWKHAVERIKVPPRALEANVFVGLCGGTGELSVDDVRLVPTAQK
jgi:protein-L-isoaspartate(D-aspartate) O-methyltransferase